MEKNLRYGSVLCALRDTFLVNISFWTVCFMEYHVEEWLQKKNWEGCRKERWWPILWYYPTISQNECGNNRTEHGTCEICNRVAVYLTIVSVGYNWPIKAWNVDASELCLSTIMVSQMSWGSGTMQPASSDTPYHQICQVQSSGQSQVVREHQSMPQLQA